MARRGPGEGSVRQRKDRKGWEVAIATGRVTASGNPERISVYGKTRREALDKAAAMRPLMGRLPDASGPRTLNDLSASWIGMRDALQDRTIYTYQRELEPVLQLLGRRQVRQITPSHVQGAIQRMQADRYSYRATGRALMHLRSIFELATHLGLTTINPAKHIKLSRPRVIGDGPAKALSKAEVGRLLEHLDGTVLGTMVFLILSLGLRRGELLGLEWSAIDLRAGRLIVRSVFKPVGRGSSAALGVPKTARSLRTIPFGTDVADALEQHREVGPTSETHVFVTRNGTLIHPRNLSRDVGKAMQRLGIHGNVHALRHTYASLMLSAGMPVEVVSHHLGHAQVSTTMNNYRHLFSHEKSMTAPSLEELLHG